MPSLRELALLGLVLVLGLLFMGNMVFGWTNPSQNPPGGNAAAPLNAGGTSQTKAGSFLSSATLGGVTVNATTSLCIAGDCKTAWSQVGPWTASGTAVYYTGGDVSVGISSAAGRMYVYGANGANTSTAFRVDGVGNYGLTVSNAGNVGIGLGPTAPGAKLDVYNGNANTVFLRGNITGSPVLDIGYTTAGPAYITTDSSGRDLNLQTNGGDVGIGTATPGTALQIARDNGASGSDTTQLRVGGKTDQNKYLAIGMNTTGNSGYIQSFYEGTGYFELRLQPNGGNFYAVTGGGTAYKPGGGSWSDSSDSRLKKNVVPMTGGLDKISKLSPVYFDWRNPSEHAGKTAAGGFIAQDVMEVFPGWIVLGDADGADRYLVPDGKAYALTLPYEFDALLVSSVQELDRANSELRSRLKGLEAENEMLRVRVEKLESDHKRLQ